LTLLRKAVKEPMPGGRDVIEAAAVEDEADETGVDCLGDAFWKKLEL
jgi:hypothetical protein